MAHALQKLNQDNQDWRIQPQRARKTGLSRPLRAFASSAVGLFVLMLRGLI
jgi:hypothetical protein